MAIGRKKKISTRKSSSRTKGNTGPKTTKSKSAKTSSKPARRKSSTDSSKVSVRKKSSKRKPASSSSSRPRRTVTANARRRRTARNRKSGNFTLRLVSYWSAVAAVWAGILFVGMLGYFSITLPDPVLAGLSERSPNLTILAANGKPISERGMRRDHIRIDHLPQNLVNAVLAIEDRRFYNHFGVDPLALVRAASINLKAGGIVQGGSTISQQLAKNLFLKPERTIGRKMEELLLAFWLEFKFTKKEILELYLNRVYFGAGTYGVEAAAQRYFGKSARNISLSESALLAGLLKAPSRYAPTRNPDQASARAGLVLRLMAEQGLVSKKLAQKAIRHPARVKATTKYSGYEYAVDWIADLLPGYIGDTGSDLVVETTLDPGLQKTAQAVVAKRINSEGKTLNANEAAVVVMDNHGAVKAMVGGRSYKKSQFNRAVKAMRQPGSAFKPFVYLAALEDGMSPFTIVQDRPISIGGWTPKNYSGRYQGRMSLRDSLAKSVNSVAVRLMMNAGRNSVVKTARRLGINSALHNSPSLALGTAEVSLIELTTAYVPFANGGNGVLPHIISRVRTSDGRLIYAREGYGPGTIIEAKHVGAMNYMLASAVSYGTGRAASLQYHRAAGKTGTSQDFRDAWFVGYTAQLTAGIWVGNDNGDKMRKVTGGGIPARIWRDIMQKAHRNIQPRPLPGTQKYFVRKRPVKPSKDDDPNDLIRSILSGSMYNG